MIYESRHTWNKEQVDLYKLYSNKNNDKNHNVYFSFVSENTPFQYFSIITNTNKHKIIIQRFNSEL